MTRKSILSTFFISFLFIASAWSSANADSLALENQTFRLEASCANGQVAVHLLVKPMNLQAADSPYLYSADIQKSAATVESAHLQGARISKNGEKLVIAGSLAGLELEQSFELSALAPYLEERIALLNHSNSTAALANLELGMQKRIADASGAIPAEYENDRWTAIPFRHRADDEPGFFNDFSIADLFSLDGYEPSIDENLAYKRIPSRHRYSEGWAWTRGKDALGIFKFNQEHMEFSVVSKRMTPEENETPGEKYLRFGGACAISGEPAVLTRIAPRQKVNLGVVRYQYIPGGYTPSLYAFRKMLDEKGCRFPKDYNPLVHWNELYNLNEAWNDRANRYTKQAILEEAAKAKAYHCEALYLDPGWDTDFGTFLWGEKWLGDRKSFVDEIRSTYGLGLSLHCPLATWMSGGLSWGLGSIKTWPPESLRKSPNPGAQAKGPAICLGSKQYREEAERRMLANCADGAGFLMFDGNWWNGGCDGPNHGHPVPYRWEDHIQANLDLAQRVHAKYPKVLIEMHDTLAGGSRYRITPVYYKYGLPGSYDDNWGFELMWDPLVDIKEGRGASLYYYNMACNVPVYLHVDLRKDNEHCLVLWWFASTCRHLGIGGTHENPAVVQAQQQAMKKYHDLERFYKIGEFYGIGEEIHVHAIPAENAFTVNLFNLSNETRTVAGQMDLREAGFAERQPFICSEPWGAVKENQLTVSQEMPPWSAAAAVFQSPIDPILIPER